MAKSTLEFSITVFAVYIFHYFTFTKIYFLPMKAFLLFLAISVSVFSFAQNTTSSGLAYEIFTKTDGPKAKNGQEVKLKILGALEDGTVFQEPAKMTMIVGQEGFLPGFLEAVEILKLGEKGRFIIPPHLGYGEKGARDDFDASKYLVPPNSTIIFEIELMKIK